MATRRDIIDAVYSDVQHTVTGDYTVTYDDGSTETITLTDSDVLRSHPDSLEQTPAVFVDIGDETPLNYNGVGLGPDHIETDGFGNVEYIAFHEYAELDIFLTVRGESRAQKEPIYEQLRRRMGRYADGNDVYPSSLQEDVSDITIDTTTPADSTDMTEPIWGTQIQLFVAYARRYIIETGGSLTMDEAVANVPALQEIQLSVDADTDDTTTGFDYNVT